MFAGSIFAVMVTVVLAYVAIGIFTALAFVWHHGIAAAKRNRAAAEEIQKLQEVQVAWAAESDSAVVPEILYPTTMRELWILQGWTGSAIFLIGFFWPAAWLLGLCFAGAWLVEQTVKGLASRYSHLADQPLPGLAKPKRKRKREEAVTVVGETYTLIDDHAVRQQHH